MTGNTLIVSRAVNLHGFIKKQLEALGFRNVTVTAVDKDGLSMLIRETKPQIVIMGCKFNQFNTPSHVADLHKQCPSLNIAVVSTTDFPDDLAMYCIINGAKSYVNLWDGPEQFFHGLEEIRRGHEFISKNVQRRIEMRDYNPKPTGRLTARQIDIVRAVANGYTGVEIADTLHLSVSSVATRKKEIYTALNVRNENELIRVALYMGIIQQEELNFFARDYELKPKPMSNEKGAMSNDKSEERKVKREEGKKI